MTGIDGLDVSRETFEKLQMFSRLVQKWTAKINLISKSSVQGIWHRHILDSTQIFNLADQTGRWVDLGSGGGFPGIVAAILSSGVQSKHEFIFVESDQRKAVFLRTAIRELSVEAMVISERIEDIPPLEADILSARALADLGALLGFSSRHLKNSGVGLFPKGAQWQKEHDEAQKQWSYQCEAIKSKSDPDAAILKIKDISRA